MKLSRTQRGIGITAVWLTSVAVNCALLPSRYLPHVKVEKLERAPMPLIVRASGNLEAKDSNSIRAQFDGPVVKKAFREGQKVARGELLAVLGRDRIQLDYQNKLDGLKNAEADLDKARKEVRMQKALYRKQAVAYSTVEDANRAQVKAKQGLRSAQEAMRLEQARWDSANVVAPLTGTVVKDWLGDEKTAANGKEIVTVADVSEFTVHARVDELDIKQVKEGQGAEIRLQVYPQTSFRAVVTEVGSSPDGSGLPQVSVVLKLLSNEGLLLRPKLTAEARILIGKTSPILSVPLSAIANADGEPRVWVLGVLDRLHNRKVELGQSNPDRAEILRGLSAGQRFIVTAEPDFASGERVVRDDLQQGYPPRTRALIEKAKNESKSATNSPSGNTSRPRRARSGNVLIR